MSRLPNVVRLAGPERGLDGRSVLGKARAPLITDGRIGDFWVDSAAKKLYGPKTAAGWPDNGLIKGDKGWTAVTAIVSDGTRRVIRIVDWTGGEGTEPSSGQYVGATGLVADIADAVDIRGPAGPAVGPGSIDTAELADGAVELDKLATEVASQLQDERATFYGADPESLDNDAARDASEAALVPLGGQVYWPAGDYDLTEIPTLGYAWGPARIFVSGVRQYLHPIPGPVHRIFAEVFGLVNDVDDTGNAAKIQRAVDFAQDTMDEPALVMPRGWAIRMLSQVVIKQGRGVSDPKIYKLDFDHNACLYMPTFADHAFWVQPQCTMADDATGRRQGECNNYNGTISNFLNAGAKGVRYGRSGYSHYPYNWARLHDFKLALAASDAVLIEGGKIAMENLSGLNAGVGLKIIASAAGDVVTDITGDRLEFQGDSSHVPLTIQPTGGTVRGVKLDKSHFYGKGSVISAGPDGELADIWVTNSAISFEPGGAAPAGTGLSLYVDNGGTMYNVFLLENYIAGFNGNALAAAAHASAGEIYNVKIRNVFHANDASEAATAAVVLIQDGFNGVTLDGSEFSKNVATIAAAFVNCEKWSARGCDSFGETGTTIGIYAGAGCDDFVVTGNRMNATDAVVVDPGAGANRVVADNLATP